MEKIKLLLFDLDGTLLRSDKTISAFTLRVIHECREKGILIGVSTSRSEKNSMEFINELNPDIVISSAGALAKYNGTYIYKAEFTEKETAEIIRIIRQICGIDSEITVDTVDGHYWNYKIEPRKQDKSWGDSIYTDFTDFSGCALKICVEIPDLSIAERLRQTLRNCDSARFSDGNWYKFTKKTATKENAIIKICSVCGILAEEIMSFGDDYADIGMLKLCGKGIAMGNAIEEVKSVSDIIIGDNDGDGIAHYLTEILF